MNAFVNCHTHTFNKDCLPPRYFPCFPVRILSRLMRWNCLARLLAWLDPSSNNDIFNRIANVLVIGSLPDQRSIFERLIGFYPEGTKFVVHSMDMDFMGAGAAEKDFPTQLRELKAVRDAYPDTCLPFVCADPRRPDIAGFIRDSIERDGFKGIKIYPPYGYFPYDPHLDGVYEYAQSNGIPVLTHCGPAGFRYRGGITEDMRRDPLTGERLPGRIGPLSELWVHPGNYRIVMMKYPDLKLCLAHMGGIPAWDDYLDFSWESGAAEGWFSIVLDLMREYPNVYADVSNTVHKSQYFPLLKVVLQDARIRSKVLYGSDFYMVAAGVSERRYWIALRGYLGEEDFRQIAEINPSVFLS